jgi:HAD superfamily hydrolase (TIGR01509 family)
MKPKAVLFDFDGTLADTEPLHHACWREVLRSKGVELTWEYYRDHCIGISDREMLAALGRLAGLPQEEDEISWLYALKKNRFIDIASHSNLISPATREAVLAIRNVRLGVVTSCERADIAPILKREGLLCALHAQVYGDDVIRLKPAPEPYLLALERLGVQTALVFEDSLAGVQSAMSAGCRTIHVKHPSDLPGLLRDEGLIE